VALVGVAAMRGHRSNVRARSSPQSLSTHARDKGACARHDAVVAWQYAMACEGRHRSRPGAHLAGEAGRRSGPRAHSVRLLNYEALALDELRGVLSEANARAVLTSALRHLGMTQIDGEDSLRAVGAELMKDGGPSRSPGLSWY
jgi:hypothetical protein